MQHDRLRSAAILVAGIAALTAGGAAKAVPSVQNDAQCLVLSNALAKGTQDANAQRALFAAHFFYLGRLRGEIGTDKLAAAIADAEKGIVPANAGKMMQACGAAVQVAEKETDLAGRQAEGAPAK